MGKKRNRFSRIVLAGVMAMWFSQAGQDFGVSPRLLTAIAKVESGFDRDAVKVNKNGTRDVGIMQVNSWWENHFGPKLWKKIETDTRTNIRAGAYILSECISRHGETWKAVGCYHSQDDERQETYIGKVSGVLQ